MTLGRCRRVRVVRRERVWICIVVVVVVVVVWVSRTGDIGRGETME